MGSLLQTKVNKASVVLDMEIFGALRDIAAKHKCPAGSLTGVYVAAGLDTWMPDFRKSMVAIFGKDADRAIDALHLEGWLGSSNSETAVKGGGMGEAVQNPVDGLAEAWTRITGEAIPVLTKRRLYSQMCSQFSGGPAKMPHEAARLYKTLFPKGSFSSFVTDAYKYCDSMDKAAAGLGAGMVDGKILERWKGIWAKASKVLPGSKFSSDPYVFFCCAANPDFNENLFERNLASYSPWDAMAGSVRKKKRQPEPDALMVKNGDLKHA